MGNGYGRLYFSYRNPTMGTDIYNTQKNMIMKLITRVYNMGNKLGVYLNSKQREKLNFKKSDRVYIRVCTADNAAEFISSFNYNITLRKQFVKLLKSKPNDKIVININPISNLKRTKKIFCGNKIDLLALIPEKTFSCSDIFVTQFKRNDKQWLRIWYSHERGSGRQVELIRYVDIAAFGRILGQLQAEGDKLSGRRKDRIVFANNLLAEHNDFITDIFSIGISAADIQFCCKLNIRRFDKAKTEHESGLFCQKFGITNLLIKPTSNTGVWRSFMTIIRRSIVSEVLLNSMDTMRKLAADTPLNSETEPFDQNFLAKVLTGDGTIDIRKREYDYPTVRINIVDQNLKTLEDYKKILQQFGFRPKVNKEHITVRAHCSFENMLLLYKIKAFKNSNNRNKLIVAIMLMLRGRRIKTFERFTKLSNYGSFGTGETSELFGLTRSMAKDWLSNGVKTGFMEVSNGKYVLTDKAKEIGKLIPEIKTYFGKINKIGNNLWDTLDYLKLKKAARRTVPLFSDLSTE